jgi:hypothetical protein
VTRRKEAAAGTAVRTEMGHRADGVRARPDRGRVELRRLNGTETDFFDGEEMIRPGAEPTPSEPRHIH